VPDPVAVLAVVPPAAGPLAVVPPTGHEHGSTGLPVEGVVLVVAALAVLAYLLAARRASASRPWPRRRSALWVLGVLAAAAGAVGPTVLVDHVDLVAHMVGHLLLGMAAPLLLVLAAPVTLLLRTLDPVPARRVVRLLRSLPVRVVSSPVVAAVLSVGGLWLLFRTDLWSASHDVPLLGALVSVHVFASGCLFTAAVVGVDPDPHRASFVVRSAVVVLALAAHDVLAASLAVDPPPGTGPDSRTGALVMYLGGDVVDLALVVVLWSQWARRRRRHAGRTSSVEQSSSRATGVV
jgi:putative membrane protein